jgi:flagellar motor component MotA
MKNLIQNRILVVFGLIVVFGILIRYILGGDSFLWALYEVLDTASAVALAALAFFGYMEYSKSEDKIKIYFKVDNQKQIDTNLSILRKNFSRSEVFGLLGMIQKDAKGRFDIAYSRDKSMLDALHAVQKGDKDSFVIPINSNEFEQFDVKKDLS